jgi:hypothetical protein
MRLQSVKSARLYGSFVGESCLRFSSLYRSLFPILAFKADISCSTIGLPTSNVTLLLSCDRNGYRQDLDG